MRIIKLRLKNGYKRFFDLTIDLGENPSRIVALVGPNGCGKSSVFDGLLHHANAHLSIGAYNGRDASYHSMFGHGQYSISDIEINFDVGAYGTVFAQRQRDRASNTIFSFRSPYRYNSNLKIESTSSVPEIKLNNYGASDASSIDDKMEYNYRRLYAHYNYYRDMHDLRPSEAKNEIIKELNSSISNCLDIKISSLGNVEGNKGTLYFEKKGHPSEFEFNVLSSGEKEVVDLLLDLYLRKNDYTDTIFLIDEPELHINTAIQGKLLVEIDRLIGDNCQIWLTTHSIGMLRALQNHLNDKCQIIYFDPELNLADTPQILKPIEIGPGTWRKLFEVALDDLAYLVSPNTIIYCEGRAEPGQGGRERGLDAQVFNNIFIKSHPDTLFTSSGGNTEPEQRRALALAVLGKVFPTVKIWILKDRDIGSGKNITEEERKIYLETNDENHRVLIRWEIENYLYDKEVLKAYCADKEMAFDESAYDNLVYDIKNQNLKDVTSHIKNICGIKTSINQDTFKLVLSKYIQKNMLVYKELEACIFERK
jgi:energy-coupling factor transporter ATP-binding protein EcfA2